MAPQDLEWTYKYSIFWIECCKNKCTAMKMEAQIVGVGEFKPALFYIMISTTSVDVMRASKITGPRIWVRHMLFIWQF